MRSILKDVAVANEMAWREESDRREVQVNLLLLSKMMQVLSPCLVAIASGEPNRMWDWCDEHGVSYKGAPPFEQIQTRMARQALKEARDAAGLPDPEEEST